MTPRHSQSPPDQGLNLSVEAARQLAQQEPAVSLETIKKHVPVVKTVINRLGGYLPPDVPEGTLIGKGILALMEAAESCSPDDPEFEQFAQRYVWQAVAGALRQSQCFTQESGQALHTLEEVCQRLTARGRAVDDQALAQALEVSVEQIREYLTKISTLFAALPAQVLPTGPQEGSPLPHFPQGWQSQIAQAIAQLPQQEQLVVALYYFEDLSFPEIAEVLGMPTPRLQQVFGRAAVLLRVHLVRELAAQAEDQRTQQVA